MFTRLFRSIILFMIFALIGTHLSGQTTFEGGIYSDTKWTREASPYIITGNVVVFPTKTLTIEPGVEIRFDGKYYLEIRGYLMAVGTMTDSITFTSNLNSPQNSDWHGLVIKNSQGARATIEYCNFSYAENVASVDLIPGEESPVCFEHCIFDNNYVVLSGYASVFSLIDSCRFTNNEICIQDANKKVTNSVFERNQYVLFETEEVYLKNCSITENNIALYGRYAIISNCDISRNQTAVKWWYNGFELIGNTIENNQVGIEIEQWSTFSVIIKHNTICNNTINVKTLSDKGVDLTGNCWCTTDSSEIEAGLIDGYDDISLGLFNYDIYDEDCSTIIASVVKDPSIEVQEPSKPEGINDYRFDLLNIFPNPACDMITFKATLHSLEGGQLFIYDNIGRIVHSMHKIYSDHVVLDVSRYDPGLYFFMLQNDVNKIYSSGKFLVE